MNIWQEWKRFGILPISDVDLMGQDALVVQIIRVAENEFEKVQTKRQKEAEKQAKRQHEDLLRVLNTPRG